MSTPRGRTEGSPHPIRRSSWAILALSLVSGLVSLIYLAPAAVRCIIDVTGPACTITPGRALIMLIAGLICALSAIALVVRGLRSREVGAQLWTMRKSRRD